MEINLYYCCTFFQLQTKTRYFNYCMYIQCNINYELLLCGVCTRYVFKRLKWMGNRNISQGATLFFLALWHGTHSGYYNNFALEFIIIKFERDVSPAISSLCHVKRELSSDCTIDIFV